MSTETLPTWFWMFYYLFLLITMGSAVFQILKKKRMQAMAVLALVFALTIPFLSLANSIGRSEGFNELEHLLAEIQLGSLWSIYVMIGYFYLLLWWGMFLIKCQSLFGR